MNSSISFFKITVMLFLCFTVLFSCSKDEEEVVAAEFSSASFDIGHLTVKMIGIPAVVDSIEYTNLTKGITNTVDHSGFIYDQPNNMSVLSVALASGNLNDQVQCCVYLNSSISIGVAFKNITSDSITTTFTSSSIYCQGGNY